MERGVTEAVFLLEGVARRVLTSPSLLSLLGETRDPEEEERFPVTAGAFRLCRLRAVREFGLAGETPWLRPRLEGLI